MHLVQNGRIAETHHCPLNSRRQLARRRSFQIELTQILQLAGTSKKASCASFAFTCIIKDDLNGECNDAKAYITAIRLLSMLVLVSNATNLDAIADE